MKGEFVKLEKKEGELKKRIEKYVKNIEVLTKQMGLYKDK